MARLLRMPEVAANTLEATLSEWLLSENAAFSDGDSIATVETDKAAVDVPAEGHGVLVRTLIRPGTTVAVGAPMALIAAPGEQIADVDAVLAELGGASPGPDENSAGSSVAAPDEAVALDDPGTTVELAGQEAPEDVVGPSSPAPPPGSNGDRILSSPLARRLVREHGLSLQDLTGTGPGGRIVRNDVRRAIDAKDSTPAPVVEPTSEPAAVSPKDYEDIPHSRMRRAIAARLGESNREAPDFAIRGSARVDELLALRAKLNQVTGTKISVNDLIVAAVARTHAEIPEMNVVWTPDAVRRFTAVDIGVAVATDRGLVTPVLRGAENLTVSAIARATADFAARARAGTLRPDELDGGSITVSNLGGYGTEDFTAVLNPPQAAILAVGAAGKEAVVTGDELGIATVLRVTLTVDHRPVDGVLAARWMAAFRALLAEPLRILA